MKAGHKIKIGEGLAGQCFMEEETIYLKNVPQDFLRITSGLGDANPDVLLYVPIQSNEELQGVLELVSFRKFEEHEIQFIEQLASNLATAIGNTKVNQSTKVLLERTQQQTEEMRAQEEEMRQNMEEMEATQEEMQRKNNEINRLLEESANKERTLQTKIMEFDQLKQKESMKSKTLISELEGYKNMLVEILNEIPAKVFLKDAKGQMFLVNQQVADIHGTSIEELIGKSDYDFVDKKTADEWRKQEQDIMKKGEERYVFEDKIGGKTRLIESRKKKFYIPPLKQFGLLGIQRDISGQ